MRNSDNIKQEATMNLLRRMQRVALTGMSEDVRIQLSNAIQLTRDNPEGSLRKAVEQQLGPMKDIRLAGTSYCVESDASAVVVWDLTPGAYSGSADRLFQACVPLPRLRARFRPLLLHVNGVVRAVAVSDRGSSPLQGRIRVHKWFRSLNDEPLKASGRLEPEFESVVRQEVLYAILHLGLYFVRPRFQVMPGGKEGPLRRRIDRR